MVFQFAHMRQTLADLMSFVLGVYDEVHPFHPPEKRVGN